MKLPSLRDSDDRAQFLALLVRFGAPGLLLLVVGETLAWSRGWFGTGVFALLLLLNLPLIYGYCLVISGMVEGMAGGVVRTIYAGQGLAPNPVHSPFEALAARGLYREAQAGWEAHLAAHPGDHAARLKLAELHRSCLGEPAVAERLYLEVRRGRPTAGEELLATNLLIELYRATGRRDRLMVELARFADRYRGTRAGRDAARALHDLKADSPPPA